MARNYRVEVRLSSQEHQVLNEYANKFGMTHSEAVRRLIHQLMEDCKCFKDKNDTTATA